VCYEDEGVYVNTYGRITKDVVLQWGEMPTSVGTLLHTLRTDAGRDAVWLPACRRRTNPWKYAV
jgi:hypothetical protein